MTEVLAAVFVLPLLAVLFDVLSARRAPIAEQAAVLVAGPEPVQTSPRPKIAVAGGSRYASDAGTVTVRASHTAGSPESPVQRDDLEPIISRLLAASTR